MNMEYTIISGLIEQAQHLIKEAGVLNSLGLNYGSKAVIQIAIAKLQKAEREVKGIIEKEAQNG